MRAETFEPFVEWRFQAAKAVLAYVEGSPNGAPLVLLHGVGSRWQPFLPILPALAEKHTVYALDLRGHGRSSHTPGAYRLDDYTGDVHQFISQRVQAPVAIYGHSLGALIAINLAAQHPHSVRSLVLGEPPLYYHDTPTRETAWQAAFTELLEFITVQDSSAAREAWLAENMPHMSPERRAERVDSLAGLDPDVVRAMISDALMEGVSLPALLPRVVCPVLLLAGNPQLGSVLRAQDVEFARAHFPACRVLAMDSIGHGIVPANLLPQVLAFLEDTLSEQGQSASV
jgi:pimeloyl-ACP methyl ester carboxylesterase